MTSKSKRFILILSFFLLLTAPKLTFGWGASGHNIISEIAFRFLNDRTRANIMAYLDGMSIEEAGNWMDEVRGDNSYDYMRPYHYADFSRGEPATNLPGNNIIGVLNLTMNELSNINKLSPKDIKTKLLYLFHLIGDLHQPLHVGYAEDRGGNKYQISFFGDGSNLHKVWDRDIIDYKKISLQDVLASDKLNLQQIKAIQNINIIAWANESRDFLKQVYSIQGHKMTEQYINLVYPIIERQLLYAGLRLASVLEKFFDNIPPLPKIVAIKSPSAVNPEDAAKYAGQTVTVCGKIFGGIFLEHSNGSPTLVNMGAAYPNNPFTMVIYGSNRSNFSYAPEEFLTGKVICVTGMIKMFKGKPEMIVSVESDIHIQK